MRYWLLAATACLLGTSAANAEYMILRVWLNKHVAPPQSAGQFGMQPGGFMGGPPGFPPGGQFGGPPGVPGVPPGGMFGNVGMPPGGPGRPGGRSELVPSWGGLSQQGPPPSGGGGPPGGPPGGFMGGPPMGPPGGGVVGFAGGIPGFPGGGFLGFAGALEQTQQVTLNPDDYVTACVAVSDVEPIRPRTMFGKRIKRIDGQIVQPEDIGINGNFHFRTKWGFTWITPQPDITVDYRGVEKQRDRYPDPKKMLSDKSKETQHQSPEGRLQLAEWCLEVGLPDDATRILDNLSNVDSKVKETYKPSTLKSLEAYAQVKPVIDANAERTDKANSWKDRLGYSALSVSKHYALVHQDNVQESANRRLDHLENNFKTVYVWFAIRGKALPAPSEKLVGVIVGEASEFRRYRDTFEASNLAADGFHARRENLAVFSARRLDKASVNFEQLTKDVYRQFRTEDLFKVREAKNLPQPDPNNAAAPKKFAEYARASTIALVDAALQQEAEIASASHEGTRQIFGDTGLLPRNVMAPEWVRFGIAALFETPKGPFPGKAATLKVAMYPGGGGPHWAYMRYFEEMRDSRFLSLNTATEHFIDTVLDQGFRSARKAEAQERAAGRKVEGTDGDSKALRSEELYNQARTLAWSLVYFLAKARFDEFTRFLEELAKLPRDAELDGEAVIAAFGIAYGLEGGGLGGAAIDVRRFMGIGAEWMTFMGTQQSPSRRMKLEEIQVTPGAGAGPGGGFPPGVPGIPPGGGGFPPGMPPGGGFPPGMPPGGGFPPGGPGRPGGN